MVFGSSLSSSSKKKKGKNFIIRVGPPLTKLSGSAHQERILMVIYDPWRMSPDLDPNCLTLMILASGPSSIKSGTAIEHRIGVQRVPTARGGGGGGWRGREGV